MGKRGPKPSGNALTGAERQRRYRERHALGPVPLGDQVVCLEMSHFEWDVLRRAACARRRTPEELAAMLLKDAIWAEGRKLR